VMLVGRLFHARATVTRNDRSPMVLSRVYRTRNRKQLGRKLITKRDQFDVVQKNSQTLEDGSNSTRQNWRKTSYL